MDLNFCDICNESVPAIDLDLGSARKISGRVICASCEQAMSHEEEPGSAAESSGGSSSAAKVAEPTPSFAKPESAPPSPAPASGPFASPPPSFSGAALGSELPPQVANFSPAPTSGNRGGMFLIGLIAVASLVVSSIVTIEFGERIQGLRSKSRSDRSQLETKLGRTRSDLLASVADLERTQRASQSAGMDTVRSAQRVQANRLNTEVGKIQTKLEELNAITARITALEAQSRGSEAAAARLSSDLSQLNREVNKLVERWMEAIETGDVVASADSEQAEDAEPEWMEHATRLSSPSAATRWNAVTALGDAKDDAVVPYLVGMLKDPDTFVRIATARILEDLGSFEAVGDLIEALTDAEVVVREVVVTALRKITGENHRFDPAATEAERARRVKAWREWWKKNGS